MPPQCCRCNGNGRCRGCVCVRSNRPCTNCLPRRQRRCENIGDDSRNGITDGAQLEPPEPPEIHQSELPPAEYDSEHTESEQRNGTVRCVREGTNGGDGIDVGDGSMPNNYLSHVEFANDQTSQSANMLSADRLCHAPHAQISSGGLLMAKYSAQVSLQLTMRPSTGNVTSSSCLRGMLANRLYRR